MRARDTGRMQCVSVSAIPSYLAHRVESNICSSPEAGSCHGHVMLRHERQSMRQEGLRLLDHSFCTEKFYCEAVMLICKSGISLL